MNPLGSPRATAGPKVAVVHVVWQGFVRVWGIPRGSSAGGPPKAVGCRGVPQSVGCLRMLPRVVGGSYYKGCSPVLSSWVTIMMPPPNECRPSQKSLPSSGERLLSRPCRIRLGSVTQRVGRDSVPAGTVIILLCLALILVKYRVCRMQDVRPSYVCESF